MKKLSCLLALILAFTMTACSESAGSDTPLSTPEAGQSETASKEKEEATAAPENNTEEDEEMFAEDPENTDDEDWDIDPFDPTVSIEFDSVEEYEQYLSGLDRGSEVLSKEELDAFISENYEKAYKLASFCRGYGPSTLDIGVNFDITESFTGDDGMSYNCSPTDLSSKEEFWASVSEYFSAAAVEQLKKETGYLLYEKDSVLYVAIGAKGGYYNYDIDTVEIVQQAEERITLSMVKSYFLMREETIALRDLVKEDGKWKFDFIM